MNITDRDSCLVFDVGGTSLRAGRYDFITQSIINEVTIDTPNIWVSGKDSERLLFSEMNRLRLQLFPKTLPSNITVGFPGPVDSSGNVLKVPTVWSNKQTTTFNLAGRCRELWPYSSIRVLNDVTAAGFACTDAQRANMCIITVSSGIGNKVFLEGKPILGPNGRGGEIGHWRVDFSENAPQCDCGEQGHLGSIGSGRGAVALIQRAAKNAHENFKLSFLGKICSNEVGAIDSFKIAEAFQHEDEWLIDNMIPAIKALSIAIAMLHTGIGIENFHLMGGFATALGENYRKLIAAYSAKSCWSLGQDWDSMIHLGKIPAQPGLIGAGKFTEWAIKHGNEAAI